MIDACYRDSIVMTCSSFACNFLHDAFKLNLLRASAPNLLGANFFVGYACSWVKNTYNPNNIDSSGIGDRHIIMLTGLTALLAPRSISEYVVDVALSYFVGKLAGYFLFRSSKDSIFTS